MGQILRSHANLINMKVPRKVAIVLAISIIELMPLSSNAQVVNKTTIVAYAGSILTPLELSAAITLWTKESNIRPEARNGSHAGICQGRSKYLLRANYMQQVRWCISYSWHRYGTMVRALNHFKLKGWH